MKILDELNYAEGLLEKTGKRSFLFREILSLAKYFKHLGKNQKQIESDLYDYCQKHYEGFNRIVYRKYVDSAILICKKIPLRVPKEVPVTQNELNKIRAINDRRYEKVLFVFLIYAKYLKKENQNDYYVNEKIGSILKMAKVSMSKEDRLKMLKTFYDKGYIQATLVGSFRIGFVDEVSPPILVVADTENFVDLYPIFCVKCGKAKEYDKHYKSGLCDDCYKELRKEKVRQNVKNYRLERKLEIATEKK